MSNLPEKHTLNGIEKYVKPSQMKAKQTMKSLKEEERLQIDHIKQDWKKLKSDLKTLAVVAGSAYIAYRATMYLLKPSSEKKSQNTLTQNDPNTVVIEKAQKKSSPILDTIKTKLVLYALDFVSKKVEEQFSRTK